MQVGCGVPEVLEDVDEVDDDVHLDPVGVGFGVDAVDLVVVAVDQHDPAALVLGHPDSILAIGSIVAGRMYDRGCPIVVLDTAGTAHALDPELALLRLDGAVVLVGLAPDAHPMPRVFTFTNKRRSLAGSSIGGIAETQEMLDFCAEREIESEIELIRADQINDAYERMLRSDVRYRFVIDVATMHE